MDKQKYDRIAKKLAAQLNEKGTLIRFKVLSSLEYTLRNAPFFDNVPLDTLTVEFFADIGKREMSGSYDISRCVITDGVIDPIELILGQIAPAIAHAIIYPDSVSQAKYTIL